MTYKEMIREKLDGSIATHLFNVREDLKDIDECLMEDDRERISNAWKQLMDAFYVVYNQC